MTPAQLATMMYQKESPALCAEMRALLASTLSDAPQQSAPPENAHPLPLTTTLSRQRSLSM
jgi:hypothetical protein